MTNKNDITVTLELDTDYTKYGNSTDMQIDTLAIAVTGEDWYALIEYNEEYIYSQKQNAIDAYGYEADFVASLTKEKAHELYDNADAYAEALKVYTEDIQDKARDQELPDGHALTKDIEEAEEAVHKELRHDWLYDDYRGNFDGGIIRKAQKRYGLDLDFDYDEKTDVITVTIPAILAEEWRDNGNIDKVTKNDIRYYLTHSIENDAEVKHQAETAKRKARAEEYKKTHEYTEARRIKKEGREEAERKAKLEAIINKK